MNKPGKETKPIVVIVILLFVYLVAMLLSSCGSMKKISKAIATRTDSTVKVSNNVVDLKKKDSTYKGTIRENVQAGSDSTYKKTTIITEYYSDEFDFGNDGEISKGPENDFEKTHVGPEEYFAKPPGVKPGSKPGKGKIIRETKIIEEGNVARLENKTVVNDQTGTLSQTDSSHKKEEANTTVKKKTSESVKTKSWKRFLPGAGIAFVVLVVLFVALKLYKNENPLTQISKWLQSLYKR